MKKVKGKRQKAKGKSGFRVVCFSLALRFCDEFPGADGRAVFDYAIGHCGRRRAVRRRKFRRDRNGGASKCGRGFDQWTICGQRRFLAGVFRADRCARVSQRQSHDGKRGRNRQCPRFDDRSDGRDADGGFKFVRQFSFRGSSGGRNLCFYGSQPPLSIQRSEPGFIS